MKYLNNFTFSSSKKKPEEIEHFLEGLDTKPLEEIFNFLRWEGGMNENLEECILELKENYGNNAYFPRKNNRERGGIEYSLNEEGDTKDKSWNFMVNHFTEENLTKLNIYERKNNLYLSASVNSPGLNRTISPFDFYASRTLKKTLQDQGYDMNNFNSHNQELERSSEFFLVGNSLGILEDGIRREKIKKFLNTDRNLYLEDDGKTQRERLKEIQNTEKLSGYRSLIKSSGPNKVDETIKSGELGFFNPNNYRSKNIKN